MLADFITTLSEGNPLFVSESLSYLHNEDLLFLDKDGQWRWDMDKIRLSRMPTTVVALFSSKIRKLPPDLIDLLEYCACMGNTFSPAEIASIREMTLQETFEMLKPALGQGLLMENKSQLQFIHDRVQEAVLASIPAQRRRASIGRSATTSLWPPCGRATRIVEKNREPVHHRLPSELGAGRGGGRRNGLWAVELQLPRGQQGAGLPGDGGGQRLLQSQPRTASQVIAGSRGAL